MCARVEPKNNEQSGWQEGGANGGSHLTSYYSPLLSAQHDVGGGGGGGGGGKNIDTVDNKSIVEPCDLEKSASYWP